jgi:uncharacterized protein
MVETYVAHLQLKPHPEGGYYKETYRSKGLIDQPCLPGFNGGRNYSTAIYFLLQQGDYSAFHRIKSDECWHFYDGGTLLVHEITPQGEYKRTKLGRDLANGEQFQYVVPANNWFASEPAPGSEFALVGCTVAPGFDFADFEMAKGSELSKQFEMHDELIRRLSRL